MCCNDLKSSIKKESWIYVRKLILESCLLELIYWYWIIFLHFNEWARKTAVTLFPPHFHVFNFFPLLTKSPLYLDPIVPVAQYRQKHLHAEYFIILNTYEWLFHKWRHIFEDLQPHMSHFVNCLSWTAESTIPKKLNVIY